MNIRALKLTFDPRLPAEAVLLRRLDELPSRRRSEWLRRLVLSGLLGELHLIRNVPEPPSCTMASQPIERSEPMVVSIKSGPKSLSDSNKPLAHLAGVIG